MNASRRGRETILVTVIGAAMLAVLLQPRTAEAQWSGWSFYWENDTWVREGGSDDAFTNGIRLVLGRSSVSPLPLTDWLADNVPWFPAGAERSSALVLGQNMFTPLEITDYVPDANDRPFAGLAYVGARWDFTEPYLDTNRFESRFQHSLELDLGVVGSWAGAEALQSGVHSTITTHRIPKGWPYQLRNAPALTAMYETRLKVGWDFFDVVTHGGVLLGNVQTYPFAGGDVRVGWNMSGLPTSLVRNTAAAVGEHPGWEFALSAGVEGRAMVHNAPVEGRLFEDPGVDPKRGVWELRLGGYLRLMEWRLSYTWVERSPEVEGMGPSAERDDRYGSVALSYEPTRFDNDVSVFMRDMFETHLPAVFDGFVLEAGFGAELGPDEDEQVDQTHAMHVAVGHSLGFLRRVGWSWGQLDNLDLLFEVNGTGREFGPVSSASQDHLDRILRNLGLSLRYRLPVDLAGEVHLRGGWGRSLMEYEATPRSPGDRLCPAGYEPQGGGDPGVKTFCVLRQRGSGPTAGVGYTYQRWPFNEVLGLNVDLAFNRTRTDTTRDFWTLTGGIRWVP